MRTLVLLCLLGLVAGCSREPAPAPTTSLKVEPGPVTKPVVPNSRPRIVFLGDSLTAGLGLPSDQSYPHLIGMKLKDRGYDFEIVNAGVSGDTSAGGSRRLDWSLEGDVRALVLALGANDGLRGLPTDELKKNLRVVLDRAKSRNIPVVLAGMEAPPNNGPEYTRAFRQVYSDLAKEYDVRFVPFLLLGVAGNPSLNQGDGIHPNARGAEIVADLVLAELEPVLRRPN
jgi:acyl-CoA thioesterase-1